MKYTILIALFLSACLPTPLLTPPDEYPEPQLPDFVPALQPFVNEGCNTAWDNVSAIVSDTAITYFVNLPDYTEDPHDYDKSRFTFIYQSRNPWYGIFEGETPYSHIQTGWKMLPVDDYGNVTCQGLQEIRIWVLDELTDRWYMNSQVCWAGYLCNGQVECEQGYQFNEIEYADYTTGHVYLQQGTLSLY